MIFKDRNQAGQLLGKLLKENLKIDNKNDWIILAIPRGGLPVAYEVGKMLNIPINILVVKKLAPFHLPEFGFGAMAPDGSIIYDENYMYRLGVTKSDLEKIKEKTLKEIKERIKKYSFGKLPKVNGKNVIIIDDGIATGYTAAVAALWAKNNGANKVILAIPVCPAYINRDIAKNFDQIICLYPAENFQAVGQFYVDFHQITDDEYFDYLTRMMADN